MKKFAALVTILLIVLVSILVVVGCTKQKAVTSASGDESYKPGQNGTIILATTTSTKDTGLLDVLIPEFERKTGIKVKTIAVGTGEALKMGERGDADVLLVNARRSEDEFMAKGFGKTRRDVMHSKDLLNPYGVIAVNPAKFPKINYKGAIKFVEFLTSIDGQSIIKEFGKDKYGQPLFVPDVLKSSATQQKAVTGKK